jgi:MFS family permease
MMDLSLFRIRVFWAGNTSLFLNALSRGSIVFIMSWYFQAVLQDSPFVAGLKLLPLILTMIIVAPLAGRWSDKVGSRWLSTIGLAGTAAVLGWMATFEANVPYPTLAVALAIMGTGNALFNAPNTSAVMGSVPPGRRGVAAGARIVLFNTGQMAAIALSMVILSTVMSYQLLAALFVGTAPGGQSLNAEVFMQGFREVFLFGAAVNVVAVVCSSLRGTEYRAIQGEADPWVPEPAGVSPIDS